MWDLAIVIAKDLVKKGVNGGDIIDFAVEHNLKVYRIDNEDGRRIELYE